MRLFRKKTLTQMELVANEHQAKATAYDAGWVTQVGPEFESVFRCQPSAAGMDGAKRLIVDRDQCIVFTQEGPVTGRYPFWLALDQKGFGYPITPPEHAITYELAEETIDATH